MSKKAAIRNKQLETDDPLVMKITEEANMDPEYVEMMNDIENDTEFENIPPESELKQLKKSIGNMSIVTLEAGTRLIVKGESEIPIPKKLNTQMLNTLHFTHSAAELMIRQSNRKIFWPGMKKYLKKKYEECEQCQENKASQVTPHNQVSGEDMFKNFLPGQRVQVDYAKKGNANYLMIVDSLTGFM